MRVFHSVVIREKPPSKRPRKRSKFVVSHAENTFSCNGSLELHFDNGIVREENSLKGQN